MQPSLEASWPSGLGRWCCNPEVPGSRPPPCHYLDLFLGSPESNPRSRFVNRQLVCLLPVGIFNCVYLKLLFPLFQWHACKLAKFSACILKCMTTIKEISILHVQARGNFRKPTQRNICFIGWKINVFALIGHGWITWTMSQFFKPIGDVRKWKPKVLCYYI